jgi:hypothetical protein
MIYSQFQKPPLSSQINWSHPLSRGLVGAWLMNEGSGNILQDVTLNNNTLNTTGVWSGGNQQYNGASTYASMLKSLMLGWGYPLTMTVRFSGAAQSDKRIFAFGSSASDTPIYAIGTGNPTTSKCHILIRNDNSDLLVNLDTATTVMDSLPHTVTFVDYLGTTALYVDGVRDSTNFNYSPSWSMSLNRTAIGALLRAGVGSFFSGNVYFALYHNRALSAQEVAQLYQSPYAMFEHRPVWMDYVASGAGIPVLMVNQRFRRL